MRKYQIAFLLGVLSLSFSLYGATALKIGTVDFQKALITVEEGKKTKLDLEKEAGEMRKMLEAKAADLKKMEQELKGMASSILSDAAKMQKGQEFQQKYIQLRQEEQQLTQQLQKRESEEVQKVFRKLRLVTKEIAKKKKLDLVVEQNASGLIYAENTMDLTDDVIVEYDRRYKSKAKK